MSNTAHLRSLIAANAAELTRLRARIHETFRARKNKRNEHAHAEWQSACAEFHARYEALAFPGGYEAGLAGIAAGNLSSIEAALCFLEVRPYFFRSGYMYKVLLRKIKRAQLSAKDALRLQIVLERQEAWRARKAADGAD